MKLIIDIDEDVRVAISRVGLLRIPNEMLKKVDKAIQRGTPLPKGHGALKDTDKIISDGISKGFCDWYDEIKYADTIIEADKEQEE